MRRLALILLVGLLSAQVAGAFSLLVPEPCGTQEPAGTAHNTCPPTCVLCGCCHQPVVPSLPTIVAIGILECKDSPIVERRIVSVDPAEILHVPKASLA